MKDHKFVRLEKNKGALVNTDKSALDAYKLRKKNAENARQNTQDIAILKNKINRIEELLIQLLEK